MLVDLEDGVCRECGGQLEITDVDDATMEVRALSQFIFSLTPITRTHNS